MLFRNTILMHAIYSFTNKWLIYEQQKMYKWVNDIYFYCWLFFHISIIYAKLNTILANS